MYFSFSEEQNLFFHSLSLFLFYHNENLMECLMYQIVRKKKDTFSMVLMYEFTFSYYLVRSARMHVQIIQLRTKLLTVYIFFPYSFGNMSLI